MLLMKLRDLNIVFSGLKLGTHHFKYQLDQKFFDLFDFTEMEDPSLNIDLVLLKKSDMLELDFTLNGSFTAYCDVTGEPFNLALSDTFHLVVKFGLEYNNDNEEVLILSFGTYEVNIAQYLYELAVLSIPSKRVHPDVESGKLSSEALDKYRVGKEPEEGDEKENETDPRWDKLKDLLDK
jgi:uncharacterized metal-binding protein YceD (DUF177 family)